jgi:hypothetical protein
MDSFVAADGPLRVDTLPPMSDTRDGITTGDTFLPDGSTKKDTYMVVDAVPPDSGARFDVMVADPPPPDSGARDVRGDSVQPPDSSPIDGGSLDVGAERPLVVDTVLPPSDARDLPKESSIFDPLPPDSGARDGGTDVRDAAGNEPPFIVDPVVDSRWGLKVPLDDPDTGNSAAREHWTNTSPMRIKRSQDLPLCLCPEVRLAGEWQSGRVRATISGVADAFSVRWQAQGQIEGQGDDVLWTPSSDEDQLDVAVRTRDGVAVTLLRLGQVRGSKEA